jgi:hypothetical protein
MKTWRIPIIDLDINSIDSFPSIFNARRDVSSMVQIFATQDRNDQVHQTPVTFADECHPVTGRCGLTKVRIEEGA